MKKEDFLKLASIFHYVFGGLAALTVLYPLSSLAAGLRILEEQRPGFHTTWIYRRWSGEEIIIMSTIGIVTIAIFAALIVLAGRSLSRHSRYMFCLVMAGIECIFMPFGTILGVFTIVLLTREPVQQLFSTKRFSRELP